MMPLKLFTCTDHDHHWPVGVAPIVLAESEAQARELLDDALAKAGLSPYADHPYTLTETSTDFARAIILLDGNY